MLVKTRISTSPEVKQKSSRPREHEVSVVNSNGFVNITATPFGIGSAGTLAKFLDFQNR